MKKTIKNPALCFIVAIFALFGMLTTKAGAEELPEYIQNSGLGVDAFNIETDNYKVFADSENGYVELGDLDGENRQFSIVGNGYSIDGILADGVTKGGAIEVSKEGQTLLLNNISNFTNFENSVINEKGTLQITDVKFTNNSSFSMYDGVINSSKGTVTIDRSAFNNNASKSSGAIEADNNILTITNSSFSNNSATDNTYGLGGAISSNKDVLTINNVNFANNQAKTIGGAIYSNNSTINIDASSFSENTATENGGAIYIINGTEDTPVTIAGTTFEGNKAGGDGGAFYIANTANVIIDNNTNFINNVSEGGAGGAIATTHSTLKINNTTFKGNSAVGNNALGGAIFASESNLTITQSTFGGAHEGEGNSAVNGGAIFSSNNKLNISDTDFTGNNSTENGGAIYIINGTEDTPVTITDSTFNDNKAGVDGGAIFVANTNNVTINNSDFINNSTENGLGGAIASMNGSLTLDNVLFKGNSAAGDLGFGGAIGGTQSALTITNSTFGGAHEDEGNSAVNGGAVYSNNSILDISETNFTANTVTKNGGAVYILQEDDDIIPINILNSSFTNNSAGENGGALYIDVNEKLSPIIISETNFEGNNANKDGGAIYVSSASNMNIDNTKFINNRAENGVGGAIAAEGSLLVIKDATFGGAEEGKGNSAKLGGAIYANDTILNIENTDFLGNNATENGGALYIINESENAPATTILETNFVNNTATNNGGAISVSDIVNMTITNSTFTSNSAEYGGAISAKDSVLTISGSSFGGETDGQGNSSTTGGAIELLTSEARIDNTSFTGNRATGFGGAINSSYSKINIDQSHFIGNSVDNYGGAIFSLDSEIEINNTDFSGNTATKNGGAMSMMQFHDNEDIIPITILNSSFTNNSAGEYGGALNIQNQKLSPVIISETNFEGNNANNSGGAIHVSSAYNMNIDNAIFMNNKSENGVGGAIAAEGSLLVIKDATFGGAEEGKGNSAKLGGAIYSNNTILSTENTNFTGNTATESGGAVYILNGDENVPVTFSETIFEGNKAIVDGGAIYVTDTANVTINNNSQFVNNSTENGSGGAIAMDNSSLSIENSTFNSNQAQAGGSINVDDSYLSINNSKFLSNKATNLGGAINLSNEAVVTISDARFNDNSAINGGAIYAEGGSTLNLTDVRFVGNNFNGSTAENAGGAAIYATDSDVIVSAVNSHVVFYKNNSTGTIDGEGTGIEIERGNLTLNANQDKQIAIYDEVLLADNSNLNINNQAELPDVTNVGTIFFSNKLAVDGTMTLSGGKTKLYDKAENNLSVGTLGFNGGDLDLRNGVANTLNIRGLNLSANSNLYVDLDLTNKSMDNLNGANGNVTYVDGKLTVTELNLISDAVRNRTKIKFTDDENLKDNVVYTGATTLDSLSGLYKYDVKYLSNSGDFQYDVSWFHPVLYGSSVAMQGTYLAQVANYETALGNLDQKMLKTQAQRNALKYGNKYAAIDETQVYSPLFIPEENKGVWFKPYANFEDVKLDNGPKVKNQMYGSLIGGDTDLYTYSNGWDAQYSVYVGYNGSHQKYAGNNIYQNGGNLGLTGAFFKGNFFEGLTLNVGMSNAEIKTTIEGTNDLGILSTGIASKTGYNWELANGKFIIQPSFTMSYSFIAPLDDYTLDSGVRIKNKNMNAIQLVPQLKFIGNIGDGWQPYASCRMAWNIIDDAKVKTDEIFLPETTVKPYFEYGVGLQKTIGERFSGFGQAMLRAGGRIGAGFTLGFRWAIGDLNDKHQ